MPEKAKLNIDVHADVVCPWCYLGLVRLKKALEMRPDVEPEINWRPFQLAPALPEEGVDYREHMAKKFDPAKMKEMQANMTAWAKEEGVIFNFAAIQRAPNTNAAHRLIRWAKAAGKQSEVAEGVMRAYFSEGKFIGDVNVLADIGAAAGLERAELLKKFAAGTDKELVSAEHAMAKGEGITNVPHYSFNGTVTVEGSYPEEDLVLEIDKALKEPLRKAH
jgi:predicted DsbA family dithiol-disulfide isomerase